MIGAVKDGFPYRLGALQLSGGTLRLFAIPGFEGDVRVGCLLQAQTAAPGGHGGG